MVEWFSLPSFSLKKVKEVASRTIFDSSEFNSSVTCSRCIKKLIAAY